MQSCLSSLAGFQQAHTHKSSRSLEKRGMEEVQKVITTSRAITQWAGIPDFWNVWVLNICLCVTSSDCYTSLMGTSNTSKNPLKNYENCQKKPTEPLSSVGETQCLWEFTFPWLFFIVTVLPSFLFKIFILWEFRYNKLIHEFCKQPPKIQHIITKTTQSQHWYKYTEEVFLDNTHLSPLHFYLNCL